MSTTRPDVLDALAALIKAAAPAAAFARNGTRPERVEKHGSIVFRDGDPGEAEQLLGDPAGAYLWSHAVEVELAVSRANDADRTAALDDLVQLIDVALTADPTLGGRCDMVTATIATGHEGEDGAAAIGVASLRITLEYQTRSPLGF